MDTLKMVSRYCLSGLKTIRLGGCLYSFLVRARIEFACLLPLLAAGTYLTFSPYLSYLVYAVAAVLFIPPLILTLGAGFVFAAAFGLGGGAILATLSVFIGASLGAILSFLLGRYLLRDFVQRLTKKYTIFEALDAAVQQNGLKIFLLLRLSPIIPYNATNYIGGVSAVSFRDFVLALFGTLPGIILYVFLGASAGSLAESSSSGDNFTVTIIVVSIGAVFGIATIWLSARYARKELYRIVQERQAVAVAEAETGDEMKDVYLAMAEPDVESP
jgi:uncharacterized membrane protein YdjX (TVP38/TMEM64 family)